VPCPRQAAVLLAAGWTGVLVVANPVPFVCSCRAAALAPVLEPGPAACGHGRPAWSLALGVPAGGRGVADLLPLLLSAGR
jgi:hypothetical protein